MIYRQDGETVLECCRCGETEPCGVVDDLPGLVAGLTADGWDVRRDDEGDWTHLCPACVEDREYEGP